MKLRIITWIMAFFIFIVFSPPAVGGPDQQNPAGFTDINGHWASEAIVLSNSYGFMDGYPDKQFKPDNSLSRAEALTLIGRSMGWSIPASGKSTVESGALSGVWKGFRGYIELAAEKQLIGRNDIVTTDFNKPSTRLEVSVWLARALNLNGNGYTLKFSDLYTVPASQLNPLAGVVEAGIITGLPGNRFNPSGPLNRAEMAAMLLKMLDNGKITPITGQHLVGKLVLKDRENNKISLQTTYGTFTYGIAPYFMAFQNGRASNLDLVNVGDNVRVTINRAQKCQIISYYSGNPPTIPQTPPSQGTFTLNGTVKYLDGSMLEFQTANGASMKFPLSAAIKVTEYGNSVTVSAITGGKSGTITVSDGRVLKCDLYPGSISSDLSGLSDNKGYVINKYWDSFSVRLDNGTVRLLSLQEGISFLKNGQTTTYAAFKPGTYVELKKVGLSAETVNILEANRKFFGRVDRVNPKSLTIRDEENRTITCDFSTSTQIRDWLGYVMVPDEISVGSYVEITLDSNDAVTSVLVRENYGIPDGTVEEIWTAGNWRIIITDGNGRRTYYMRENVTVTESGVARSINAVMAGMKVRLVRDSNNYVTGIEITSSRALEGKLTYINNSGYGSGQIQIQKSSGTTESYYLAPSVQVMDGYSSRSMSNLTLGMNVRLTLDSSNRVSVINITGSEAAGSYNVEGRITYISRSDYSSGQIQIQRSNGRTESYYLATSVQVMDGYSSRSINHLSQGMHVRLILDSSSRVLVIDIASSSAAGSYTVEGRITFISSSGYGSGQIQIQRSNGRTESYYLATSVQVKDEYSSRSISYLTQGMNVRLSLDVTNRATLIDITSSEVAEGLVTSINSTGSRRIEIRRSNGVTGSYYLSDSVLVREGYTDRTLDYITVNMNVSLTLNSSSYVTRIDISNNGSYAVEGRITYFNTSGDREIRIQRSNGGSESYRLAPYVQVRDGSVSRSITYLIEGMNVRLSLDSANRVTLIDITGSAVIEGIVTYIQTTGSRRIEIRTDSGSLEVYYLPAGITVRDWGIPRSLDSVITGMRVKLFFDINETPIQLEITGYQ